MKLGTLTPSFRLGSTTPSRIYLGTNLVWESVDSDAADYFARITAEGSSINETNKAAVNAFIVGCKADGIWSAIKASCILAGADNLAGALVPLVGAAPTNFNFVEGDYSRTAGLVGDGTTKALDSSRNNNADPQNSHHLVVWMTTRGAGGFLISAGVGETGVTLIAISGTFPNIVVRCRSTAITAISAPSDGFLGKSRDGPTNFNFRNNGFTAANNRLSQQPYDGNMLVFARGTPSLPSGHTASTIAFYSIGEHLDLALLDARLTTLMSSLT